MKKINEGAVKTTTGGGIMRRMILVVAVAVTFCSMAFAGAYEDGIALYRDGKHVEAIVELQKVDGTDANYYNAQLHVGHALRGQGKHEEAMAQFESVKKIAGLTPEQIVNGEYMVAHCLYSLKRWDEAITKFRLVAGNEGATASTREASAFYVGQGFYVQQRYDEAIAEYKKIPEYRHAQYYHAAALKNQGKTAEAEAKFKAVLKTKGHSASEINGTLNNIKDISDVVDGLILQLRVQTDNAVRKNLIKRASEKPEIAREVVKSLPTDLEALAELKPALALHQLNTREQAEIHKTIWMANLGQVVSNEDARAVVDGAVTALTQLLGLSENPSISEVDKKIAEMK